MNIVFIGPGYIGYGIALNLLRAGNQLKVIAHRRRERITKLVEQGASEASNYDELITGAEVVFTCVGTAEQVKVVVDKAMPFLSAANLWIDCTTSRPQTAIELSSRLIDHGVNFVDAPQ